MLVLSGHHQNNCLRCPLVAETRSCEEELVSLGLLRFNLRTARSLCRDSMLHRVDRTALADWLTAVPILPEHLDYLPAGLGPGIMVTLPNGLGRPLIDGNHRAARAQRDGTGFLAYVLPESQTRKLLIRSMGRAVANQLWNRLRDFNQR